MAQISRRDFLKGSVATGMLGAVAATGLGCAPAQQTSSEALSETGTVADAAETSSWRVAPESVAEDAIVDETVADIVVIGAAMPVRQRPVAPPRRAAKALFCWRRSRSSITPSSATTSGT